LKNREKMGLYVKVHNNNINTAISQLKKMINEDGLKKEMREKEQYTSKSERRRKEKAAAIRRALKRRAEQEI
jgi:small subunit ribosomal protein S21